MKTLFLVSDFPEGFTNEFIYEFTTVMKNTENFTYICSSFDDHETNVKYANKIVSLFQDKNINFKKLQIIDYNTSLEDTKMFINNTDVIWIAGGDTIKQMKYLNEYKIKDLLLEYQGIIIGMSAGAINMADKVILPKDDEEDISELSIYNGLGLVDINIEPHLDFNRKEHIEEIKEASKKAMIYGLYDNSFICVQSNKHKIYGEYFLFKE